MQRHHVLIKFYDVAQKIKESKFNARYDFENEETTQLLRQLKLPHSAKKLLTMLHEHQVLNQRTIAKKMNISSQAVSELIKKLSQKELIIKKHGMQKNENLISLTPLGEQVAVKLNDLIVNHANTALKELDDRDVEKLYELLNKILVTTD